MYRLYYTYYRKGKNFMPVGETLNGYIEAETISSLNAAWIEDGNNHNVFLYTPRMFCKIEKIS